VPADAEALHARAVDGETVVWLSPDADLVRAVGLRAVTGGPAVELVHGSYDPPGARLLDVVAVMDRLRSPGGCPWDAEQTHTSLMPYLLEEAYEAYAALEDGDLVDLREELGDVPAAGRLPRPAGAGGRPAWSIDDVAATSSTSSSAGHPHVFAGTSGRRPRGHVGGAQEGREGPHRRSPTACRSSQPRCRLAAKLQRRAGAARRPGAGLRRARRRAVGARAPLPRRGLDPELALRTTARAYRDRLAAAEAAVLADGLEPAALTPEQWEQQWA
jgi:XTP/dITP diphosphohydrolase